MIIAEAFLIAAMALPAVGYTQGGHMIVDEPTSFSKLLKRDSKFLAVGGDPVIVANLRNAGMRAFGALTMDLPGATQWHSVTEAESISFKSAMFATVLWRHWNPAHGMAYQELKEAARLTEPLGRLIFFEDNYPYWSAWLTRWGWKKLLEVGSVGKNRMVGYQKPFFGDYSLRRNLWGLERWERTQRIIETAS